VSEALLDGACQGIEGAAWKAALEDPSEGIVPVASRCRLSLLAPINADQELVRAVDILSFALGSRACKGGAKLPTSGDQSGARF
jgi:hypothetical protein